MGTFQCRFGWGRAEVTRAWRRGDIIVIVDVLSFSTTVATAVSRGAVIFPQSELDSAVGHDLPPNTARAVRRGEVPRLGRFSLSPVTMLQATAKDSILLSSLNGARCCEAARAANVCTIGCLLNATAVARSVSAAHARTGRPVTIVACGELFERGGNMTIRYAVEDYLGAGSIIAGLKLAKSPAAKRCECRFKELRGSVAELLLRSRSGRELIDAGFPDDVLFASQVDSLTTCPVVDHSYPSVRIVAQP